MQIAYTDNRGRTIVTARWLSQLHFFAAKVYANGGTDVRWRPHGRAPYRALPPNKVLDSTKTT